MHFGTDSLLRYPSNFQFVASFQSSLSLEFFLLWTGKSESFFAESPTQQKIKCGGPRVVDSGSVLNRGVDHAAAFIWKDLRTVGCETQYRESL